MAEHAHFASAASEDSPISSSVVLTADQKACPYCSLTCTFAYNLRRHLMNTHKVSVQVQRRKGSLPCPSCASSFSSRASLRRHQKKAAHRAVEPPASSESSSGIRCPDCRHSEHTHLELVRHLETQHRDLMIQIRRKHFETLDEFAVRLLLRVPERVASQAFKQKLEQETDAHFCMAHAAVHGQPVYFECSRQQSPDSVTTTSRQFKAVRFCPAFMQLTRTDDELQVLYCAEHYGHSCEVEALPLSSEQLQILDRLIGIGFTCEQIKERCATFGGRLAHVTRTDILHRKRKNAAKLSGDDVHSKSKSIQREF